MGRKKREPRKIISVPISLLPAIEAIKRNYVIAQGYIKPDPQQEKK